jgi:hypothetical protein
LSQSLFWWLQYHCTTGIKTFFECHVLKVMWLRHNQEHSVW